ncbi:MAG TPA: sigma-54 dependent transcriptional regulator [Bryobacteraceae bacterium]|nr:sigma-54 dependent transcriptional regulator [Bryobacteraceae bacterium]
MTLPSAGDARPHPPTFGRNVQQFDFLGMPAIVASRAMQRILEKVEKVACTDSIVLIAGESGVGKELIARAIHHFSNRKDRPFVDVNCAAFPENLVESELFGYEKGAFSGADTVKPGMFEAAANGTIFLDEIGELEARMQAKLLRVLDGQPYFRLGGTRKIQNAARVVTATNTDLRESVQRGSFRADLFHRLDAIELRVPPLRERVDDIPALCEYFLSPSGASLRDDALELLKAYSWPGNIRELRNILNKAVVFADSPVLTPGDLPPSLQGSATPDPGYSLERLEEQTIFRALEQTGGHQQKAADILGISRRTLIRKLKQYGPLKAHARRTSESHGRKSGPGVAL